MGGLTVWSFLMATAHGAGLMVVPVFVGMSMADGGGHAHHAAGAAGTTASAALVATGVHAVSYLAVTAFVAVLVFDKARCGDPAPRLVQPRSDLGSRVGGERCGDADDVKRKSCRKENLNERQTMWTATRVFDHRRFSSRACHRRRTSRADNDLVKVVREATERFRDVAAAEAEGYQLLFGCVSGPDSGAMGLHYVNLALVGDGELDPAKPEIVIYEPSHRTDASSSSARISWCSRMPGTRRASGRLNSWDSSCTCLRARTASGCRAFYTLHVWAWKENPTGMFVNWHSKISCEGFKPTP